MTDGLKPAHRQAIIDALSANPKVERIVLFGSRATGTFTLTSDVDLALFGDDLTLSDQAALAEAVAELSVPQRVDILIYHRIASQALREEIRKHGVEWFARERATQAVNTAGDWQELPFSQAVIVNPRVHLKRGEIYSFVDMNAIIAGWRSAYASEQRRFNGGGSRFAAGDTLMARITPCLENGKIARFAGRPGEVAHGSTEFIVIRGRDGVSDTSYAYYLTKWDGVSGYAISQMTGTSGRQRVPPEALDHLTVPLPPLPEQRAIAHILGTLDDKIELNRRMSETLEAMARALFKAWFVDFEPVRAKLEGRWQRGQSLPGLPAELYDLFPDRLVDSELGQIPEGWEVKAINDLAEVVGGSTPRTERAEYWEGGTYHWVTPKDLSGLSLPVLLDTERKITDAGLAQISSGLLPKGTVLLSSRAPIGYLAIAEVPIAINQGFIAIKPRFGVSNLFLLRWAGAFHDEIVSRANGSTFLEISKSNFRQIRIVAPSSSVMDAFDRLSRSMYYKVVENERESRALAGLRDALLPKLIRGEMRVRDAERFLEQRGL
jgi:type I restriction enzyme S subunit